MNWRQAVDEFFEQNYSLDSEIDIRHMMSEKGINLHDEFIRYLMSEESGFVEEIISRNFDASVFIKDDGEIKEHVESVHDDPYELETNMETALSDRLQKFMEQHHDKLLENVKDLYKKDVFEQMLSDYDVNPYSDEANELEEAVEEKVNEIFSQTKQHEQGLKNMPLMG